MPPCRIFSSFDTSVFGGIAALEHDFRKESAEFVQDADDLPGDADLILGHMAYATTAAAYPHGQHLIVLREPTTRLLSHYLYWRTLPDAEIARGVLERQSASVTEYSVGFPVRYQDCLPDEQYRHPHAALAAICFAEWLHSAGR